MSDDPDTYQGAYNLNLHPSQTNTSEAWYGAAARQNANAVEREYQERQDANNREWCERVSASHRHTTTFGDGSPSNSYSGEYLSGKYGVNSVDTAIGKVILGVLFAIICMSVFGYYAQKYSERVELDRQLHAMSVAREERIQREEEWRKTLTFANASTSDEYEFLCSEVVRKRKHEQYTWQKDIPDINRCRCAHKDPNISRNICMISGYRR